MNAQQPMTWGAYGPGGANHLRLAQTIGDGHGWTKQLGQLDDGEPIDWGCPPGEEWNFSTLSCVPIGGVGPVGPKGPPPWNVPPGGIPVVTEDECRAREKAAADKAQGSLIVTTAITAVVSGLVGIALWKALA
jgi:hypothetical protein